MSKYRARNFVLEQAKIKDKELKMREEFKNMRFNITEDMYNTMLEMLVIHQMLEDFNPTKKEERMLNKKLENLQYHFTYELQIHNPMQIHIYNKFMKDE